MDTIIRAVSKGTHSHRSISVCQQQVLLVLQGSVATLFRWSWKILSYFVANLSKILRISFYQNRPSIVEVMTKQIGCVFYGPQCIHILAGSSDVDVDWMTGDERPEVLCTDWLVTSQCVCPPCTFPHPPRPVLIANSDITLHPVHGLLVYVSVLTAISGQPASPLSFAERTYLCIPLRDCLVPGPVAWTDTIRHSVE